MEECKLFPTPFQSRVKFTTSFTSLKVDATLYQWLLGSLIYLTHSRLNIAFFVITCKFEGLSLVGSTENPQMC